MNQSQLLQRGGTRGYAHLVELHVPVARVWRALTEPRLVRIWTGKEAEIDARRHGIFRFGRPGAACREAQVDVLEENRRLRLIYLPDRHLPPTDSALVDDILLDVRQGETLVSLRVLGSGIPEDPAWDRAYVRIRTGWERNLARLKTTLENPPRPRPVLVAVERPLRGLE
jgi:uncharacterized protein YndB with AHSA1/START domain